MSLLATVSLLGIGPTATAAPAPYGPPLPLLKNCGPVQPADAAVAADGTVRGFANCARTESGSISYFRYRGGTAFSQPAPYTGRLIKVAWDGLASTYLLFARPGPDPTTEQLFIGKWLDNTGQYAPATLLTTNHPGGLQHTLRPVQAALVASAGTWWAVWTEPTVEVSGTLTYSLFQRHTLLGVQPRTRITYPPTGADDSAPSLAYAPKRLTAVWVRSHYLGAPSGELKFADNYYGRHWSAGSVRATVPLNRPTYTDVIDYAGTRHATWPGTHSLAVASDRFFIPHIFPADSDVIGSTVAASGQNLFLMWWTNAGPSGPRVILAEREAGTWSHAGVLPGAGAAVRVLAQGGRGRLLYWVAGTLMLQVQN